jgi:hypothetical protein
VKILTDFVEPFVIEHAGKFAHWHYLIEPAICTGSPSEYSFVEIRVRFEGEEAGLNEIRHDLVSFLGEFSKKTNLTVPDDKIRGSHEGCHGERGKRYEGELRKYQQDWSSLVEIMQIGAESALRILRIGRKLGNNESIKRGRWFSLHPCYLHLPANQLLVEP